MTTQNTVLTCYEAIQRVASVMLNAARESDWDTLIEAEQCCASLIAHLQATDSGDQLDQVGMRRKYEIIKQLLACDAEIRNLTQPWLLKLESILGNAQHLRRVEAAYLVQ